MPSYHAPLVDFDFLLTDVFDMPSYWQSMPGLAHVDLDTAKAILEGAGTLCEQELAPLNRSGDEEGARLEAEGVIAPEGFKQAYQAYCEGGWGMLGGNPEYDGMGMPKTLVSMVEEMVQAANMALGLAPMLTAGATLAIDAHADDATKQLYLPKMYSGEWSGAMDLTEPHCGTDLGLIRTKAIPNGDGSFSITGTKIFITWGDHDMAENVIHLVLAKTPNAPEGTRGISMFLVPKFLPDDSGTLGDRNALGVGSIEHKMGIHGSATCVMNFDGAKGWLIGGENKGLAAMFTMMNYERLVVGVQGMGAADASYQAALEYAKDRIQGRSPSGAKHPDKAADPIIVHGDVRRMLLTMKAFNEAGRAFYLYCARFLDAAKYSDDESIKDSGNKLVDFLTPVAKAYMTDIALETSVLGQQVLGGHGYVREWGLEQYVRDIRITQIYEGTNGIQAMDLIGRKTLAAKGDLTQIFIADIQAYYVANPDAAYRKEVEEGIDALQQATRFVLEQSSADRDLAGTVANDYLHLVGLVSYGFMWSRMAHAAASHQGNPAFATSKQQTAQFFFARLFPKVQYHLSLILSGSEPVMSLQEAAF